MAKAIADNDQRDTFVLFTNRGLIYAPRYFFHKQKNNLSPPKLLQTGAISLRMR